MKKRFLVAAMAATLVSPLAANAGATVYGNVHLSINDLDSADNLDMNSNTSAVGVKGKEDLGGGVSAIFKVEFQIDPDERNKTITDRDQWVGLKGAMGIVKFGTMTSNYKQMGGKVDPMYRTQLEGRGIMNTQSGLHQGAGENGGRMTNAIQYSSPKMGGMQMVLNYTVSGSDDETLGLGVRYKQKGMTAYFDYIDVQGTNATGPAAFDPKSNGSAIAVGDSEAAIKIGGTFDVDALTLGLQFESAEDAVGSDYLFVSANYQLNDNDNVAVTVGDVDGLDDVGYAIMYNHKMSKRTNVYAGYGDNASTDGIAVTDPNLAKFDDETVMTVGIRHKF